MKMMKCLFPRCYAVGGFVATKSSWRPWGGLSPSCAFVLYTFTHVPGYLHHAVLPGPMGCVTSLYIFVLCLFIHFCFSVSLYACICFYSAFHLFSLYAISLVLTLPSKKRSSRGLTHLRLYMGNYFTECSCSLKEENSKYRWLNLCYNYYWKIWKYL